jgi:hypothetical protein
MGRGRSFAVALIAWGLAYSAHAGSPNRLIVKYRAAVDACMHCLLAKGMPVREVTGSGSLDRLHQQLRVRGGEPLVFHHHDPAGGARRDSYRAAFARMRARFPRRAARAPHGAKEPDLSNIYDLSILNGILKDKGLKEINVDSGQTAVK